MFVLFVYAGAGARAANLQGVCGAPVISAFIQSTFPSSARRQILLGHTELDVFAARNLSSLFTAASAVPGLPPPLPGFFAHASLLARMPASSANASSDSAAAL